MFILAISCLTTSNLPWFMDQTFQVPMQYCYLQHPTLLSPLDTSTDERHFHFGSAASFFLELFLCSSPVAYWTSLNVGGSSSGVIFFAFAYCSWGFHGKNTGVACHSHLWWTTFVRTLHFDVSWVALQGMAHSFTGLRKPVAMTRLWSWRDIPTGSFYKSI